MRFAYLSANSNIAGVHWRSDAYGSLRVSLSSPPCGCRSLTVTQLGEAVAKGFLRDLRASLREPFPIGWTFTSFDGEVVFVR